MGSLSPGRRISTWCKWAIRTRTNLNLHGKSKTVNAPCRPSLGGIGTQAALYAIAGRRRLCSTGGFLVARDPKTGKAWLAHEYGMMGAGRDDALNTGGGTELFVVIGQPPGNLIATTPCWSELCREWNSFRPCRAARHRWGSTGRPGATDAYSSHSGRGGRSTGGTHAPGGAAYGHSALWQAN